MPHPAPSLRASAPLRSVLALALAPGLALAAGCGDGPQVDLNASAQALAPLDLALDDPQAPTAQPALLRLVLSGGGTGSDPDPGTPADPDAEVGLAWSFDPPTLMVYRSTAVHFRLDRAPTGHERATCSWNFGDGSPVEAGCHVSHTFHGGQADQVVTLTMADDGWTWTSTKTVPLERLAVVEGLLDEADTGLAGLPAPPEGDPGTTLRVAFVADSAPPSGTALADHVAPAMDALTGAVSPDLVIHLGGHVPPPAPGAPVSPAPSWASVRATLADPLGADVPMAFAVAPQDRALGGAPPRAGLQMVDARHFPQRYSFTLKGAFFLVVSPDGEGEGVLSEATLKWLREQLGAARIYAARYVVSHLPLHKLTDTHQGSLDGKFRLYELFLRGRVTALVTAGYRVWFKGRYGALPVLSVGPMGGVGGTLAGQGLAQPASFAVVDLADGAVSKVFAVEGPGFERPFDDSRLPESVEVYTR